jgi:hypothetical protein
VVNKQPPIVLKYWHILVYFAGLLVLTGGAYWQVGDTEKRVRIHSTEIGRINTQLARTETYVERIQADLSEIKVLLQRMYRLDTQRP